MRRSLFRLSRLLFVAVCLTTLLSAVLSSASYAAPRPQDQPKRFVQVDGDKKVEVKEVYSTSHALLIGINRYEHAPAALQLHYALKDVQELKQVLINSYGFAPANITMLTDAEATKANILRALSDFSDNRKVKKEDRLLVYFSGHGQTVPLPDSGDMGFLIPTDADVDLNDPTNVGPYFNTCLQMSDVWSRLDASPAKHVLLIADACYSGLLAQSRSAAGLNAAALAIWSGRRARQVMTAGAKGETSEENSNTGHGTFTYQLLEELKARARQPGAVFATSELFGVLSTAVSNQTNGKQTPQMAKYKVEGEFLFITSPRKSTEKDADPTPPDPKPKPVEEVKQKDYFPVKQGAVWTYAMTANGMSIDQTVTITKMEKSQETSLAMFSYVVNGMEMLVEKYQVSRQKVERVSSGVESGMLLFTPPVTLLKLPLKNGDSWKWKGNIMAPGGVIQGNGTLFVSGPHRIATPAGTFQTMKVHMEIVAEADGSKVTTVSDYWFAPDIGMVRQSATLGSTTIEGLLKSYESK